MSDFLRTPAVYVNEVSPARPLPRMHNVTLNLRLTDEQLELLGLAHIDRDPVNSVHFGRVVDGLGKLLDFDFRPVDLRRTLATGPFGGMSLHIDVTYHAMKKFLDNPVM